VITREELFELVWAEPMVAVAKRFDVSGSYLARICSRLNVPRPARGYWAKLAVGKAPTRPTLPQPRAGDEVTWDPNGQLPEVARTATTPPEKCKVIRTPKEIAHSAASHELIAGAKAFFLAGRESRWSNYLKPLKRLLPEIHVTKASLDSALEFADELFKQLERHGHRVTLASVGEQIHRPSIDTRDKPDKKTHHVDLWCPARSTVVYVNGTVIGLAIFELTEATQMRYVNGNYVREQDYVAPKSKWARDVHWTSMQDIPCGRFSIIAYASYYTKNWRRLWKEERIADFKKRVVQLAREIEACAAEAAKVAQLGKEAAQAEHMRHEQMHRVWQEEQEKSRRQKALLESKEELEKILARHVESKHLEDFIQHVEADLSSMDEAGRARLEALIDQARCLFQSGHILDDFMAWKPPSERLARK
jgi:hypothetical protein